MLWHIEQVWPVSCAFKASSEARVTSSITYWNSELLTTTGIRMIMFPFKEKNKLFLALNVFYVLTVILYCTMHGCGASYATASHLLIKYISRHTQAQHKGCAHGPQKSSYMSYKLYHVSKRNNALLLTGNIMHFLPSQLLLCWSKDPVLLMQPLNPSPS